MNWDAIGAVADAIAAVAVVVTLIYLAIQLKHSSRSQEAAAIESSFSARTQMALSAAQSGELSAAIGAGLESSKRLNAENWIQFGLWCMTTVEALRVVEPLYRRGLISKDTFETEVLRTAAFVKHWPGVQEWWRAGGRTQFPRELVSLIEDAEPEAVKLYDWDPTVGFVPRSEGAQP